MFHQSSLSHLSVIFHPVLAYLFLSHRIDTASYSHPELLHIIVDYLFFLWFFQFLIFFESSLFMHLYPQFSLVSYSCLMPCIDYGTIAMKLDLLPRNIDALSVCLSGCNCG
eukprot:scpid51723/ scgid19794/ 